MKTYFLILFSVFFVTQSYGQKQFSFEVNRTNPRSVVSAIFYAAANDDFTVLEGLCEPQNLGDDDTKMICMLCDMSVSKKSTVELFLSETGTEYDGIPIDTIKKEIKEFLSDWRKDFIIMFKNGKVSGDTKFQIGIEGISDIPSAMVPIQYHDERGNIIDYFVLLIKREGDWYLFGI
jgi:hypothetical protein